MLSIFELSSLVFLNLISFFEFFAYLMIILPKRFIKRILLCFLLHSSVKVFFSWKHSWSNHFFECCFLRAFFWQFNLRERKDISFSRSVKVWVARFIPSWVWSKCVCSNISRRDWNSSERIVSTNFSLELFSHRKCLGSVSLWIETGERVFIEMIIWVWSENIVGFFLQWRCLLDLAFCD